MKSKFDGIVKVKTLQLEQAQIALLEARKKADEIQESIDVVFREIISIGVPQKGTFEQISQKKQMLDMARTQREFLQNELSEANEKIKEARAFYEESYQENEKMKYLKEQDEAEQLKALHKKEQRDLDEVSLQLFSRKRR